MGGMSETHRRVLLAKPRGYCAGVDRAVQAVEIALGKFGAPVYVRKQIVHNTHVVSELEKRGAIFVEETEEVPEGSVVVFSAHGIAPRGPRRGQAAEPGGRSTRPARWSPRCTTRRGASRPSDYDILLIGHEGHEEVVGTTGEAPASIHLVDGPEGVEGVQVRDPAKVVWLSQTTLSVDETVQTVSALKTRFPQLIDPPSDDICYATQNRQAAVKAIAPRLRRGDRGRLAELVQLRPPRRGRQGRRRARRLPGRRRRRDRPGVARRRATVGVTSGASVPELLVEGVLGKLAALGFGDVEEVEAVKERMSFQLPRELRK